MLTEVEMKVVDLFYRFSCKSVTIPFCWERGNISLKQNQNILCNSGIWLLLISCFALKTCMLYQKKDINDFILNGIFFLAIVANIIIQLTVVLYKNELVQLINQILHINLCWGKFVNCNIFHPHKVLPIVDLLE